MMAQTTGKAGVEKSILDNLNTAVLLFDGELRLIYINPAGEILFDVSSRHILGQQACDLVPARARTSRSACARPYAPATPSRNAN